MVGIRVRVRVRVRFSSLKHKTTSIPIPIPPTGIVTSLSVAPHPCSETKFMCATDKEIVTTDLEK